MLYFIVAWAVLGVTSWVIGTALLKLVNATCFERLGDRWLAALWLGLVVLAVVLLATSLILPLSPVVGGLVATALITVSLSPRSVRQEVLSVRSQVSPSFMGGVLVLAWAIALFMTRQVTWIDTGIYHYGVIRWLAEYGTVPGLALLKPQFGFASAWFALAAPLNPVALGGRVSALTNGFALLVAVLHFLFGLTQSFTARAKLSDWFATLFFGMVLLPLLGTHLLSVILVSPSPDIPLIFFTGAVAWSILITTAQSSTPIATEPNRIFEPELIPLILAAGAVTMKLTALPLLCIAGLFYLLTKRFSLKRSLVGSVILVALLLPMLLFSIVTAGCPLYPAAVLCLDLPWSQSAQEATQMAEVTRGWGIWFGSSPAGVPTALWLFWQWFNAIGSSKLIVVLIGLSLLSMVYVVRTPLPRQNRGQLWILGLAVVGTSFMMLQSPLLRFGIGYVVLLPVLSLAILFHVQLQDRCTQLSERLATSQWGKSDWWKSLGLLFVSTLLIVALSQPLARSRLFLPPPLPQAKVLQQQINNVVYFSPQNPKGTCWAAALPCSSQPAEDIWLRDASRGMRSGFVRQSLAQ